MTRSLEPFGERVVIRPLAREAITAGGIALPEAAAQPLPIAEIVAVSTAVLPREYARGGSNDLEKVKDPPIVLNVGTHVVYNAFAGVEIALDGDSVIVIPVSDIIAVVRYKLEGAITPEILERGLEIARAES